MKRDEEIVSQQKARELKASFLTRTEIVNLVIGVAAATYVLFKAST